MPRHACWLTAILCSCVHKWGLYQELQQPPPCAGVCDRVGPIGDPSISRSMIDRRQSPVSVLISVSRGSAGLEELGNVRPYFSSAFG